MILWPTILKKKVPGVHSGNSEKPFYIYLVKRDQLYYFGQVECLGLSGHCLLCYSRLPFHWVFFLLSFLLCSWRPSLTLLVMLLCASPTGLFIASSSMIIMIIIIMFYDRCIHFSMNSLNQMKAQISKRISSDLGWWAEHCIIELLSNYQSQLIQIVLVC